MAKYLLSVHSVKGEAGDPMTEQEMQQFMGRVGVLEEEMKAEGAWLFGGALHEAETATVVRVSDGEVLTTDGPFAEAKEHFGRLLHHRGRRPRRRPRLGVEDQRRSREADRGPPLQTRIRGLRNWRASTPSPRLTKRRSAGSSARSPADRSPS